MYEAVDLGDCHLQSPAMTWEFFSAARHHESNPGQGILAWEDAVLAADAGLDGIIVSITVRAARFRPLGHRCFPNTMREGAHPILVDSASAVGRRVKALCMGATQSASAVVYLGLGGFGHRSRARARSPALETYAMMQQVGAPREDLVPAMVRRA